MLSRTITLATEPAVQCTLWYTDKESYDKSRMDEKEQFKNLIGSEGHFIEVTDDFGQVAFIKSSMIASDMLTDNVQQNFIKANMKIDEIEASKAFAAFLEQNPELKQAIEVHGKRMAAQAPQVTMPFPPRGGKRRG